MKSPERKWTPVFYAAMIASAQFLAPQFQALASAGPAAPGAPSLPFDDPTWKALVGLAVLVNAFLYFLVWRRRTN
jgi:hypothetical protein